MSINDERKKKSGTHIHYEILFSHKKQILPFVIIWIDLECIMIIKISPRRQMLYDLTYMECKKNKSSESEIQHKIEKYKENFCIGLELEVSPNIGLNWWCFNPSSFCPPTGHRSSNTRIAMTATKTQTYAWTYCSPVQWNWVSLESWRNWLFQFWSNKHTIWILKALNWK